MKFVPMFMSYEPGAPPADGVIPLAVPQLEGNEWRYVKECLDDNWLSSVGPYVSRFERQVAGYVGVKHAIATVSGTAALHIALLVAGIGPDDEVLVPALTFIAPAFAIRYVGAWPVFIDAEPQHWQMDPERARDFIRRHGERANGGLRNRATGRRIAAILPVHILGHPVEMDSIREIADDGGLVVIEDAAESLGATYKGARVGSLGDLACLSFNGNKTITTGGGGMVLTNDDERAHRARYLSTQAKDDSLEYVHGAIGYNYRLTNVQAAIGCAQMEQLDDFIAVKRKNAAAYAAQLRDVEGIRGMAESGTVRATFWLNTILADEARVGISSRQLMRALATADIQTRPLWQPLHRSPAFAQLARQDCPVAEALQRDALSLPSSVGLTSNELQSVTGAIKELVHSSAA